MNYTLSNDFLSVDISSAGGEIRSIRTPDQKEYLWQGSPQTWEHQAPTLFPFIGRLTDGYYIYKGQKYTLDCHGFLKDNELVCEEHTSDRLVLFLEDNEVTKEHYPFSFRCTLIFSLERNVLKVTYKIDNLQDDTMYFGIGGHPGIIVPLDENLNFEDYYVEFESDSNPEQILLSAEHFMTKSLKPLELNEKKQLELNHPLFNFDALVLQNAGSLVTIASDKSSRSVTMDFSDFPFIGLWQTEHSDPEFVCLEPWSSLPSYAGERTDLETQDNLISLEGHKTCTRSFSLKIR